MDTCALPQNIGSDASAVEWNETVDVVIIGSGFAGLTAAFEASKQCERVLVLEKMAYTGGNSRIAGGGYCCWDSKLKLREKLDLGEDSWELHKADTLAAGQGYNDPDLVEVLAKDAPLGLDLMVDAGINFRDSLPRLGGHSAYRSYQIADTGNETIEKLLDYCCTSCGVEVRCNARVESLVRERGTDGRLVGVVAAIGRGDECMRVSIRATRGVIIAAGGYAADVDLRCAHKPSLGGAYSCTNHKGATGEVIRAARAVGADVVHMEFVQLYPCANPKNGGIDQGAFLCYSGTGYGLIYVTAQGDRFVNEFATREVVSAAQINLGQKPTYSVLNAEIFAKLGIDEANVERLVESGRAIKGETLDELAEAVGFTPELLHAAVDEHNAARAQGTCAAFDKPTTPQMVPLEEGPFFAIAQWPSVHYCMGGLRIDVDAHVIDVYDNVIPGLYAAGECCGGVHGIDRLAGNGIAECMVFGRIAGQLRP